MKKRNHDGWALQSPDGTLVPDTFALTKDGAWVHGFLRMSAQFQRTHWKQWDASIRAARRLGYKIVKVCVVKVRQATRDNAS